MSDMKNVIDEYAAENAALRQQMEWMGALLTDVVLINQDSKGQVRVPGKTRNQSKNFNLDIKQLKASVVITLKKKDD